ncbi:MAG: helix-turn-helix transcriptional regulator [Pseudomonadota bacterium]
MASDLCRFIDDVHRSSSGKACAETLIEFLHGQGADGVNIFFGQTASPSKTRNYPIFSYPKSFVDTIYALTDRRIVHRVERMETNLRWGYDYDLNDPQARPDEKKLALHARQSMVVRCGTVFAIPTRMQEGPSGIGITSRLSRSEFEQFLEGKGQNLATASAVAHFRIQSLEAAKATTPLSPREIECLQWLANGLRVREIAAKMGVHKVTVDMHLKNARRKLDAPTREVALAKAIHSGVIQF